MKKVLFTTLSIIAVAAMMLVSCKKDEPKPDNKDPETPTEEVDPELVGTWTIVGEANGWTVDAGVAMTDNDNVWTVAEVAVKGEGFKFVKDGSWDINLGAVDAAAKEDNVEFDLEKGGKNIKGAKDGVYSVTLNLLTKKAKIAFVKDLEPEKPNWAEFDYTPSDEYLAETNLWKAVDAADGAKFFSYLNPGWSQTPINDNVEAETLDFLTKTQSTYELHFEKATDARWQNQFYIFPGAEANFVALDPAKKYRVKFSVTSTASFDAFFKLSQYVDAGPKHEGAAMWQPDGYTDEHPSTMTLVADTPLVLETELTGQDTKNVIFIFDFGFNPANTRVCIKDIIIEEVVPEIELTDLSTINAKAADADFELMAIVATTFKISDSNSAAIVTDGTNCFYLFFNPATNNTLKAGDLVNAKGKISIYKHLIESAKNPEVTVLEEGVAVPELKPIEIESYDTFVSADRPTGLYTAVGKYVIDGNYTNHIMDGNTMKGSLSDQIDAKWNGKNVRITGWFTGTFSGGAYFRVISIEEVKLPEPVIDGNYDDWAKFEASTTGPNSHGHTTTMKAAAYGSTVYVYLKVETAEANAADHAIDSESYVYFYFDKDNNAETGSTDWYRGGADNPDEKYRVKFGSDGLREGLAAEAAAASVKCVDDATNRVLQMELKFDKAALGTATALSEVGMKIFALGYIPGEFTGNVALTF